MCSSGLEIGSDRKASRPSGLSGCGPGPNFSCNQSCLASKSEVECRYFGGRRALAPLVEEGYLEIVYGGGKEGAFLCNHPLVPI